MSTKTMRLPPRRVITSLNNKRKEREASQSPPSAAKAPEPTTSEAAPPPPPSNLLFAGYLAHEFLSKGTLLGKPWPDPTQAAVSGTSKKGEEEEEAEPGEVAVKKMKQDRYVAVSNLLKGDNGTHLPGIVNPTQLANFLQL